METTVSPRNKGRSHWRSRICTKSIIAVCLVSKSLAPVNQTTIRPPCSRTDPSRRVRLGPFALPSDPPSLFRTSPLCDDVYGGRLPVIILYAMRKRQLMMSYWVNVRGRSRLKKSINMLTKTAQSTPFHCWGVVTVNIVWGTSVHE
jgi:hypothetical protein